MVTYVDGIKREFLVGDIVEHFKGKLYKIVNFAIHTETGEPLVIYTLVNSDAVYARPFKMFASLTDKEKYPEAKQKYRFEVVEIPSFTTVDR